MPRKVLQQKSITGGISPASYFPLENGYTTALGIDPDHPTPQNNLIHSQAIVPVRYGKFSGTEFTGYPLWQVTHPKAENAYVYTSDGKIHSYNLVAGVPTMRATEGAVNFPLAVTNGTGAGFCYYNNYIYGVHYGATGDLNNTAKADLFRYGPMDGTPALTLNVLTGATFGLAAMSNVTYPTMNGPTLPNHVLYVHKDAMYVADYKDGQGIITRIKTKRTTVDGDTNDGSAVNVLDLPFGFYPTCMASYGIDLVIGAIQTTGANVNEGRAAVFFWEIGSDSFYRMATLPDVFVTALQNINGRLYAFCGSSSYGARVTEYAGGETFNDVVLVEQSLAPLQGSVTYQGERLYWGGFCAFPTTAAAVHSYGSKHPKIPKALHRPIRASAAGGSPVVTSLCHFQQATGIAPRFIVGWGDGSAKGLDMYGAAVSVATLWRSETWLVDRMFDVISIKLTLDDAVGANTEIIPTIIIDESDSYTLTTINNTNFPGKKTIYLKAPFSSKMTGRRCVALQLSFSGIDGRSVMMPVQVTIDEHDDEN